MSKEHLKNLEDFEKSQMADRILLFLSTAHARVNPNGPSVSYEIYSKSYDIARDLVSDYEGSHKEHVDVALEILKIAYDKSKN